MVTALRGRRLWASLGVVAVAAGGLGYAAADAADVVPGVLTTRPRPTPPPPFPIAPGASAAPVTGEVLDPVSTEAPVPDAQSLAAALTPLLADPALGPSVGVSVVDGLTGEPLFRSDAATPREPASVAKLLTTSAALSRLGPDATVPTRAVSGASPDEVVLVGGGDVLLAAGAGDPDAANGRAGLGDLARATAESLRKKHRTTVAVRLDDTLFAGPALGPGVTQADVDHGYVAPVSSVAVDAGRLKDANYAPRAADPAMAAARTFADRLKEQGIEVVGEVARAKAPADPVVLGEVRSAPLDEVVAYTLRASDNNAAEALARLVAVDMGRATTFADAARAVLDQVSTLGVDVSGARLADGSGLSDGSALPASVLTDVLVAAASPEHPELRTVVTGLPVAGLTGTLGTRFGQDAAGAGLGVVRAKTGSLLGTTTLAGTVRDRDGRLLAFAVLADAVPAPEPAREAVDDIAAALAACGCGVR
jgi:D-alanyl-D-alanine carboxypeptidase/D-alanyl-D-alanine-endopeptidase (penicillin-binding protein 4)